MWVSCWRGATWLQTEPPSRPSTSTARPTGRHVHWRSWTAYTRSRVSMVSLYDHPYCCIVWIGGTGGVLMHFGGSGDRETLAGLAACCEEPWHIKLCTHACSYVETGSALNCIALFCAVVPRCLQAGPALQAHGAGGAYQAFINISYTTRNVACCAVVPGACKLGRCWQST